MASEKDIINSFKNTIGDYFPGKNPYTNVQVLMLSWAETDLKGLNKEIKALSKLFKEGFNYDVSTFVIPSDGNQDYELNSKVLGVNKGMPPGSLLIVYYAGHCKSDDKGQARWWALEDGGPSLSWHITQQLLFHANSDVLLLLDCCDAALIARGTKETGRFEMIAACARNCKTVAPSSESFTRALIKELEPHAEEGIATPELSSKISENKKINQNAVFHDFVRRTPTHIILKRISDPPPKGFGKKPAGLIVFVASLSEDPKGKEIAEWIKAASPSLVMGVDIEALVLRARQLQSFDESSFASGPLFGRLSPSARQEIFQALYKLHTTMDLASLQATSKRGEAIESLVEGSVEDIQKASDAVCDAVETPILQELDPAGHEAARHDPYIATTGTSESIRLRQAVLRSHNDFDDGPELLREKIIFKRFQKQHSMQVGEFENRFVILEIFFYVENPVNNAPYPETLHQVRRISGLLSQAGKNQRVNFFHILPCLGYFHDSVRHQLGLVFEPSLSSSSSSSSLPSSSSTTANIKTKEPPSSSEKLATLLQLYKEQKIVSLGHRIHLAHALTVAVEHFQRVGWVHKGIRSSNIVFNTLPSEEESAPPPDGIIGTEETIKKSHGGVATAIARLASFDLAQPYLFGFEYARAGDAGTNMEEDHLLENNLYRHPDRWGRPLARFEKFHDVYSLGVVLFEILLWKDIDSLRKKDRPGNAPVKSTDVYDIIKKKCRSEFPHRFGDVLAQIVLTCVDFGKQTERKNEYDSQRYFQQHISGRLENIIGKL
ncbi:hypothetical protein M434DRAFT_36271 [Hypoxylon sp. CO27-5]|nr:hypothetical protein M434DRAFT_36271 [Hypoxylon sp. CO27-5]